MNARTLFHSLCAAASLLLIGVPHAYAADDTASKGTARSSQQDAGGQIYGRQLMTAEERAAYRQQMREAKTVEEREKLRAEHHESMQARARERGVTLPDVPPARGAGAGPGMMGSGRGAGPGMMGPGYGPGGGRGAGRTSP